MDDKDVIAQLAGSGDQLAKYDDQQARDERGRWTNVGRSSQIDTPEFKAWFGEWDHPKAYSSRYPKEKTPVSYVTDDNRRPLVVYHATNQNFDKFDVGRKTHNNYGILGNIETARHAIFATPDPNFANSYVGPSTGKSEGASIMPLYMVMRQPMDLRPAAGVMRYAEELREVGVNPHELAQFRNFWEALDGDAGKELVAKLKEAGFDGVIFQEDGDDREEHTTYAVFEPSQIKSATGNRGTFDPKESDITKARRWGRAGSGVFYVCPADGTVFLQQRSAKVLEPGTWGVTGGAVKQGGKAEAFHESTTVEAPAFSDSQLLDSALREVREELGVEPPDGELIGQTLFADGGFRYTTFVIAVTPEQKAEFDAGLKLSAEVADVGWFSPDDLPEPLHFGLEYTLDNFDLDEALDDEALLNARAELGKDAEFESKHPRDSDGKFSETGSQEEQTAGRPEYVGQHQAPMRDSGSPAHDLKGIYPEDFYGPNGARYYADETDPNDRQSVSLVQSLRGRPNAVVTIYRAVPHVPSNAERIERYEEQKRAIMRRGRFPKDADPAGPTESANAYYNWASEQIDQLKTAPEPEQTIDYRIHTGDWVTISRDYAKEHGEANLNGQYRILSKKVLASEIFTDGNSIHEWGYDHKLKKSDDADVLEEFVAKDAGFEAAHPRDKNGEFASRYSQSVGAGKTIERKKFETLLQELGRTHPGKMYSDEDHPAPKDPFSVPTQTVPADPYKIGTGNLPFDVFNKFWKARRDSRDSEREVREPVNISRFRGLSQLRHALTNQVRVGIITPEHAEEKELAWRELNKPKFEQRAKERELHATKADESHQAALEYAIQKHGFKPAETVEQANETLKSFGIEGAYKRGQLGLANASNAALTIAKANGDPLPQKVEVVAASTAHWGARFHTTRSPEGKFTTKLEINSSKAHQASWLNGESEGWWSQPNPILHELGHAFHHGADPEGYFKACTTPARFAALMGGANQPVASKVSQYATKMPVEFVAETYAGVRAGKQYGEDVKSLFKELTGREI